jgi:putative endopeptidase
MIRLVCLLAASTALAGCAAQTAQGAPATAAPVADVAAVAQPAPAPAPAPAAQIGTYGFDAAGMDRAVPPGDNFYQYANGTWVRNTPIPPDKSNYGTFNVLDDLSRERTRAIIEEAAKDPSTRRRSRRRGSPRSSRGSTRSRPSTARRGWQSSTRAPTG